MNAQVIADSFDRIKAAIQTSDRDRAVLEKRVSELVVQVADLKKDLATVAFRLGHLTGRFSEHRHPVMEGTPVNEVVAVALTGTPVPEPDKPGEPA
jgi:hypothetical protein